MIEQLQLVVDNIELNKISLKEKISEEVTRFKRFQSKLLKKTSQITIKEVDIREYVKFILAEGEMSEKREVLNCLKGKITLKNKKIHLF